MITENNGQSKWSQILKEEFAVNNNSTLAWVSEYANNHEIMEAGTTIGVNAGALNGPAAIPAGHGVSPIYATPLNTLGMGNPMAPNNGVVPSTPGDFFKQHVGSGDIPVSTLPMALNIALMTIGLELVPVIPTKGPWVLLSYMDFPYAGGKLGRTNETAFDGLGDGKENKPYYVKVAGQFAADADVESLRTLDENTECTITNDQDAAVTLTAKYKGLGRLDGAPMFEVVECKKGTENASLHMAIQGKTTITAGSVTIVVEESHADFVETMVDFMDGFANFYDGGKTPMTRAENETGTGNEIGLRLFSKWIQVGAYEVTGAVTRQQLQDLPLYGVDAVAKIMEAMQNEISQHINARILEHVFALGVTNAVKIKRTYGADLNTWIGVDTTAGTVSKGKPMSKATYKDIYGQGYEWEVATTEVNTSAENLHTRQRRIASRVLAAVNLIQVIGRRGRADWAVMSAKMATALQDVSGYVVAPFANNLVQDGSRSLYQAGTLMGIKIYVDPYMGWNDNRICVGHKGDSNTPGVVFCPYILADTVSITAEGTMAPKMLINSRFAIVDQGFYPESYYYTFCVGGNIELI